MSQEYQLPCSASVQLKTYINWEQTTLQTSVIGCELHGCFITQHMHVHGSWWDKLKRRGWYNHVFSIQWWPASFLSGTARDGKLGTRLPHFLVLKTKSTTCVSLHVMLCGHWMYCSDHWAAVIDFVAWASCVSILQGQHKPLTSFLAWSPRDGTTCMQQARDWHDIRCIPIFDTTARCAMVIM